MTASSIDPCWNPPGGRLTVSSVTKFELRELGRDLREVLKPGRALGQVTLQPTHRRPLVLWRTTLRVEMDELQKILEWEVRQLAGGVLS